MESPSVLCLSCLSLQVHGGDGASVQQSSGQNGAKSKRENVLRLMSKTDGCCKRHLTEGNSGMGGRGGCKILAIRG